MEVVSEPVEVKIKPDVIALLEMVAKSASKNRVAKKPVSKPSSKNKIKKDFSPKEEPLSRRSTRGNDVPIEQPFKASKSKDSK